MKLLVQQTLLLCIPCPTRTCSIIRPEIGVPATPSNSSSRPHDILSRSHSSTFIRKLGLQLLLRPSSLGQPRPWTQVRGRGSHRLLWSTAPSLKVTQRLPDVLFFGFVVSA